jgi:hypothetical protein
VKRESYHQQHHTFTGFAYDYTKASRGQVDYDIKMTETLKVNTDYLTEAEKHLDAGPIHITCCFTEN